MKTLIKNGTIVTSSSETVGDILIDGEKIKTIGKNLEVEADKVVDATGKYILPGGIDQHVHYSYKIFGETVRGFETSNAAVVGGTTTIIEFSPQIEGEGLLESAKKFRAEKADGIAMCDYALHIIMADPRPEVVDEIPALAENGYPTLKLFMAFKGEYIHADDEDIVKALMKSKDAGITVMVHAENADAIDVLQKKLIAEGKTGPYSHILSRPPMTEGEATARAIHLAKIVDAPIYIVHVSCREALDEIIRAQEKGQPVGGEACINHLKLEESLLDTPDFEGAKYVCSPPPRTKADQDALWMGLANGYLNSVSSDHCAYNYATQKTMGKDDFRKIPCGVPGVQNRLAILWTYGVEAGLISRQKLVDVFANGPAKNNGLDHVKGSLAVGYDADIVIYDPEGESIITNDDMLHGIDYCCFEGMKQIGKVDKVFLRGALVADGGKHVGHEGQGRFVEGKPFRSLYVK